MIMCHKCGDNCGPFIYTIKGFICEECRNDIVEKLNKLSEEFNRLYDDITEYESFNVPNSEIYKAYKENI